MASIGYIGGSYDKRKKHEKGKEEGEGREIYLPKLKWTPVAAVDQYMAMIAGHARK
jgi:hypothetical protein